LRARFTSEKEGFNEVDELHGATIYWYVPKRSTMLEAWTLDFKETTDDGKDIWYTDRLDTYKTVDALEKAANAGIAKKSRFYFVAAHKNINQDVPEGIYKYNEETSSWARTELGSSAVINATNYKEGYDCFYRVINTKIYTGDDVNFEDEAVKAERERALQEQTIFPYHIGEYYFSTAT
jgi:hypothetical protein